RLTELIARAPEHLAAGVRRLRQRGTCQRGLADARLALDQYAAALSPGHLADEAAQDRHLAVPADQCNGLGYGGHGANFTTSKMREQAAHFSDTCSHSIGFAIGAADA